MKPGYKQTEVGVIPEEWNIVQLGDLKPFVTSGSRGWASYYSERGSLFVRITNLSRESIYLDLTDSKFVKLPPEASEGVRTQLKEHDVLISITADIGIVGYVDAIVPSPAYINQHIALVRFDPSQASGKFVSYFLSSGKPQRLFRASTDVGAKAGMSLITVQKIQTALPPLPEQRAIAEALGDVDTLLGALNRLIAKKRDLKQAAMQQLLTGQTRLPGFHGEWEVKRLGDVLKIRHGKSQHGITVSYGKYPILASGGEIGRTNDCIYDKPSVLIGRKGTIDSPQYVDSPFWTVDTLFFTEIASGTDAKFVFYKFTMIPWRSYNEASGVPSLNAKTIENIEATFPPVPEQTAIAEVLADMDAELAALEQRREKTRALKQAMMQGLLTGRIRLTQPQVSDAQNDSVSSRKAKHNWAINEAVVIAMLVKKFGTKDYPLGRKRYTKLSYLLHRHIEGEAEGYLKMAAGPYNPKTRYGGPEKIALENRYVREHKVGHYEGFVGGDNIAQAEVYFQKWYGPGTIRWLDQFRYKSNDNLEVLATVDMAAQELKASGGKVHVAAVKEVIRNHSEWKAKLDRAAFSDTNIANAIREAENLAGMNKNGGQNA